MQQLFYDCCRTGNASRLKELLTPPVMAALQPPATNPTLSYSVILYNFGLHVACKHRHTEVVKQLLEYRPMRPYIAISMSNHYVLRLVCRKGYIDIIRLLLHYHPVDNITPFITIAEEYGHTDIVRILETPKLFRMFIATDDFKSQVAIGIQLLSYQDIMLVKQRKHIRKWMIAYLLRILQRLPKDSIGVICEF
jgi:hypothetical protein